MTRKRLAIAGLAFGLLALVAGVLQVSAYLVSDGARHLVVGIFALSIGASVLVAAVQSLRS
ncbi:hypothetical protein [Mycolicibacterium goodii]|uniref:Integral membrane protein n=1 Tax=Mycolicibacterium goodii TaxID=134601 RepID=A0ABS6HLB2_MYCGD|nr:hypothetical protein [Mycolicibacterium goodii]OKH66978.1 hypothetical protein EB74_02680 [Mycobacterium sp. SWH-M5]MBU8818814.1 hypothetical protein [Mycolicibacterium goodii]MBU8823482.1 hypothetical protein [Mycolicibacterium goodii]MBU8830135.1 hypothetical protein [Mycolicibacterium goodii]MBU8835469.1 hypothetical protein [Mycolicibacterium goodii]